MQSLPAADDGDLGDDFRGDQAAIDGVASGDASCDAIEEQGLSAGTEAALGGLSYPTTWAIKHKLMQVMVDQDEGLVLTGRVGMGDAYLDDEHAGKSGRESENQVLCVAVGCRPRRTVSRRKSV